MVLFRLVKRIGRMIFRDILFKIPKKYLVVVIVFLVLYFFKLNVFAYDMGQAPIKNKTDITTHVPYSSILEFYEYYPLFDGTWQNIEYGNNGDVYMLDTNLEFYNDDIDKVVLKGQMYMPRYSNQSWHSSIIAASYKASPSINFYKYSWGMDADTGGWFKNRFYLNSTSYNLDAPILLTPNTANFIFTGLSNGNISGYINNTAFSKTFTQPNTNTDYLHNISTFRFNYSEISNGTIRFSNFKTYNTNNEITHDFYPVKANLYGVIYYGFYDIYAGNFYRLDGVNLQLSSFGNVLTGNDIPPNMNNFDMSPYITNNDSNIINWSFDTLNIDGGSILNIDNNIQNKFYLVQYYNDKQIILPIDNYKTVVYDRFVTFSIPRNVLLNDSAIINGYTVRFDIRTQQNIPYGTTTDYYLSSYTLSLTQTEQDNINEDRTQQALDNISQQQQQTTNAINNVNDSINNTNNFLQDTTVNDSEVNINAPTVQNSGISVDADNSYNSFINGWANLFNLDPSEAVTVDIYIPNYLTGGGTKFITIRSDMVRNFLSSTNIIPGVNFNLLSIVQVLWTAMFAWFFYLMIVGFVNGIYSGELFSDKGLKNLTETYTGVAKNML